MTEDFKREIYVARCDVDDNVHVFDPPVRFLVDCKPTDSKSDAIAFGINYTNFQRIITDIDTGSEFFELDKVWVDVKPPTEWDRLAQTADYIVYSVLPKHGTVQILLRKANSNAEVDTTGN